MPLLAHGWTLVSAERLDLPASEPALGVALVAEGAGPQDLALELPVCLEEALGKELERPEAEP